jgi:hypothetical protein
MSFLKKIAAVWKEEIILNYFKNDELERKIVTNKIFEN